MTLPLFKQFPQLQGKLPHLPLGNFPTPLQYLQKWKHHHLWIKRDDISGNLHGGNKVRKLEFALASTTPANWLCSAGAQGSNWCVALALYAKQLGHKTELL
ncbi:MAG: pyridoxal-phosphate dependent enzyme, partial [Planctomycetota bacterium]